MIEVDWALNAAGICEGPNTSKRKREAEMYDDLEPYVVDFDYRKYNLIDPVIKPENMSVKDIDWAIINCYRSFYMDKLKEVMTLSDPFKRKYMIHSMKLIMNSSFIVDKLGSLGKIPPQVQAVLSRISSA